MVFNKTKRGLEKGTAIFSVVAYAFGIFSYLILILDGIRLLRVSTYIYDAFTDSYWYGIHTELAATYIATGILLLAFSIVALILSAKLIKSPLQPDGTVTKRNGIRITLLVFSILACNFITVGLLIAVLCLKDVKPAKEPNQPTVATPNNNATPAQESASVDAKLAKLKEFKELGVIDDEAFKKAVTKIIKDALK